MELHSQREIRNIDLLEREGVKFGTLRPSQTGLKKFIMDATIPFRQFLQATGAHDFDLQQPGSVNKRKIPAILLDISGQAVESSASMYRPLTKRGDPRIWFGGLPTIVQPGDLIICLWHVGKLWVGNGSRADVKLMLARAGIPSGKVKTSEAGPSILEDLLLRLRKISEKGFIPAPVSGPTAVGRLLESELGITMNSSKEADYNGIELKSARTGGRRATMFAQIPDWSHSFYSGSRQLLDAFGYETPDGRALSCTVNARKANPHGLYLQLDRDAGLLRVRKDELNPQEVVLWTLETLQKRIAEKHAETVWVEAAVRKLQGREYICFRAAHHTRHPHPEAFIPLLRKGAITMDFLIREGGDHGYLFKVALGELESLFGHSKRYLLS
jgi:MvaI/BcnI restriction endonuclease family